jgi:RNA-directed DNA polymerase
MLPTQDSAESFPYSLRRLDLCSISRLERLLGLDRHYLRALASHAGSCYSPFERGAKARPFQRKPRSSKLRVIDNPSEELKVIQRLVNERLLRPLNLPEYICGGVKGKSVLDNVALHKNGKVLIKIDIKRFFPSISNIHIFSVWRKLLGCSARISALLTQLTTFERHLPQGAPTSTMLANLVLHACDGKIRTECKHRGIEYSTWIDDMAFSSDNPRGIIEIVVRELRHSSFRVSHRKLEITGPGARKILNSVGVGKRLSVPRERLARIRSGIHKLRQGKVPPEDLDHYVRSLQGSIAHIASIMPGKGDKFRLELERAVRSQDTQQLD